MPYAILRGKRVWHYVRGGDKRTLCNVPVDRQGIFFSKELRRNERLCVNCQNLLEGPDEMTEEFRRIVA